MKRNKNINEVKNKENKLKIFYIFILAIPMIIWIIFIGIVKGNVDEYSQWIDILTGCLSSTATILMGIIMFYQNKWHYEDVERYQIELQKSENNYRKEIQDKEEKYRKGIEFNRKQDLMIRTAPYISLLGIDSISTTTLICSKDANAVFYNGIYEDKISSYQTIMLRFVIGCEQTRGLNNISVSRVSIVTKFNGEFGQGDQYEFTNTKVEKVNEVSILEKDKYQFMLEICFKGNEQEYELEQVDKFVKALSKGNNFFNINYTATNLYGISIDGELKFQCGLLENVKGKYYITNLTGISNWVNNPKIQYNYK